VNKVRKKVTEHPIDVRIDPNVFDNADSSLISLGKVRSTKSEQLLLSSGKDSEIALSGELTPVQVRFLNMRMSGLSLITCCKLLDIDMASPLLWEEECGKNSIYMNCINIIRTLQAKQAEDVLWDKAINDPKATLDRFYAIKSRMPEYRDNAQIGGTTGVQVNITIDKQPFVVDTSTRVIGDEDGQI
jgi:hypothetical protein